MSGVTQQIDPLCWKYMCQNSNDNYISLTSLCFLKSLSWKVYFQNVRYSSIDLTVLNAELLKQNGPWQLSKKQCLRRIVRTTRIHLSKAEKSLCVEIKKLWTIKHSI